MFKIVNLATTLFPVWAIFFSIWAYHDPSPWINLKDLVIPLLSVVMFSMGLTLKIEDFEKIFKNFKVVFFGTFLQFLIMPALSFFLVFFFEIEKIIAIGVILVGCAPGGTASNVICYLAKGDVALSISLTVFSTFLSVIFMPVLFWLYTGNNIDVPVLKMMESIMKIVFFPVTFGIILNSLKIELIEKIKFTFPLIAIGAIVLIIAIIVGSNSEQILKYSQTLLLIIILHNVLGFVLGFYSCSLIGLDNKTKRTIAIEVAMQNSGLATALAIKYFGLLSAVPGAFFSIWHNVSGSVVASFWKKKINN